MKEKVEQILNLDKYSSKPQEGYIVYTLPNEVEFGKVYRVLESSGSFDSSDENFVLNDHIATLDYVYKDEYKIELNANFDDDTYALKIAEIE